MVRVYLLAILDGETIKNRMKGVTKSTAVKASAFQNRYSRRDRKMKLAVMNEPSYLSREVIRLTFSVYHVFN